MSLVLTATSTPEDERPMKIRSLLPALALAAAATLLVGYATTAADTASDTTAWSYTDGSGATVTLDHVPERIIAHGLAAAALIPLGIRPVGIYADAPVDEDLALKGLDLDGIEIVGQAWGEIDLEKVAALQPDLIISEWWPLEEAYSGLEDGTGGAGEKMLDLAPIVGVEQGASIATMIEDYSELAESLGADLDDPSIVESKTAFDDALARFQAAVAAKPGLTALAISPTAESLYVAVPQYASDLSDFVSWGLDIVVPQHPDEGFEYWETLSWEAADTYQADLLLIDDRGAPGNLDVAKDQPTWTAITAAAAGAVADWPAYWLRNYAAYAAELDDLTAAISAADENLVQ
jgi:iron complex transport system substrate-binding protein